jgi:hypothetical protein
MQCTVKGVEDKKSLSATVESKQIDPLQNTIDLILTPNTDIDNDEIYDIDTEETIRGLDE